MTCMITNYIYKYNNYCSINNYPNLHMFIQVLSFNRNSHSNNTNNIIHIIKQSERINHTSTQSNNQTKRICKAYKINNVILLFCLLDLKMATIHFQHLCVHKYQKMIE